MSDNNTHNNTEKNSASTTLNHAESPTGDRLDGIDSYEGWYRRMATTNDGIHNGRWADERKRRAQDNQYVLDSIIAQLELTNYQKEQAHYVLDRVNIREIGHGIELSALCIALKVLNDDAKKYTGHFSYHPNRLDENNHSGALRLIEDLGFDSSKVARGMGQLNALLRRGE